MRSAEWISVAFFALFVVASVIAPLETRKRLKAIGIGGIGILAAGSFQFLDPRPTVALLRDLIPGLFILMGYWQSGQFFGGGSAKVQSSLRQLDERWFPGVLRLTSTMHERPLLSSYLEVAYLLCYPIVPLGIAALYLAGHREAADQFWRVVLVPTLLCYGITPLFQSLPPRLADGGELDRRSLPGLRSVNLWVLRHASIKANTLPSGHVASSLAIALVLLELTPVVGAVFLWAAASITVATVVLRYHYSIDAVLGIALALLAFVFLR